MKKKKNTQETFINVEPVDKNIENKENKEGLIAIFKPNPNRTNINDLNRFLEGFSGTTLNSLFLQYNEIIEEDIF